MLSINPIITTDHTLGELTAKEAFKLLHDEPNAHLIDVRTMPEWTFVGLPDITSLHKRVIKRSWRNYPDMAVNQNFVAEIMQEIPDHNDHLIFICRSGGRSYDAACKLIEAGYRFCYNVVDGFEGAHDKYGHRGKVTGWKASKLPWEQQ